MIVSYRGFWAASLQLILFGPLARGSADNVVQRQAQTAPTTSIAAPAAPSPTVGGNTAEVSGTFFETTWNILPSAYTFGTPFDVIYTMSTSPDAIKNQNLTLVLLFTKATSGTPSAGNIYSVLSPKYECYPGTNGGCSHDVGKTGKATVNLELNTGSSLALSGNPLKYFFFCLATGVDAQTQALTCESYSPFFDIKTGSRKRQDGGAVLDTPTGIIRVVQNTDIVLNFGDPVPAPSPTPQTTAPILVDPAPISTSFLTKVTPTNTVEVTPTAAPTAAVATSKKSDLPIGAIIGIAIGGFFVLLAAILVLFFCYRRRRRLQNQNQTEQVLLKDNMHNISRDVLESEKEGSEGPMLSSILETRPPPGGPYDHLASSAPYSGPVGRPRALSSEPPFPEGYAAAGGFTTAAGGLIPRRNPTSATTNTAISNRTDISRGLSEASGPLSPRSMRGDIYDEPYHDMPVYGDARHMPQVYNTHTESSSHLQAPFLSEPGMTDEELTRLEEEERRIDAAIAEAERRR